MEKKEGKKKKLMNEIYEKRSPLQDLNGPSIPRPNCQKSSNLSSTSSVAALSGKSTKSSSRFLLSSNSCSSYSSSSTSSSRTHLDKNSKTFPKLATDKPKKSPADILKVRSRSKENEISRKPFSRKSERNQLQSLTERQNGKNSNPVYKIGQRSKLSSVQDNRANKSKKLSEEFESKTKNSRKNGLLRVANSSSFSSAENFTPIGKVATSFGLKSASFVDLKPVMEDSNDENVNVDSATAVKTPPVEASLSPDIQCQSNSKLLVLKSAATPVCYGAGHLVSGVTDKRKCRRRGSLKGGFDKTILFYDERSDGIVTVDLQDPSIPLLAEASVRWLLSPCNEGREDHQRSDPRNKLEQSRMVCDDDSGTFDVISSPSILCGNVSDLLCVDSSYSGSGSVGNAANERRNRNMILSPRKVDEYNKDGFLFASSPDATYTCDGISSMEGKRFSKDLVRDNSALSNGSLSSGNIIQTPNSDSSADICVGRSRLEVHRSDFARSELDSIRETLDRVNLSPTSEMSMWGAPDLGFHLSGTASRPDHGDLTQVQNNVDSVSSWMSNATLDNLALSRVRISWRDGLASRTVDNDEVDCCCILSDEEIDADGGYVEDKATYLGGNCGASTCLGAESGENKENGLRIDNDLSKESDLRIDNDLSPMLLDYEPCINARVKEKPLLGRANTCAESISTDGGGLLASDDSNWNYFP